MNKEKGTLVIIQVKLMSREVGVSTLVSLLGISSALTALVLQQFGIQWNLPFLTVVLNLFVCGALFSENVYSSKSERRRYRTMCPNFETLIDIKTTAVTILLIMVPLPVVIAELSLFGATMEQLLESVVYLGSALPIFLFMSNAIHWFTVDRMGLVETILSTGLQSSSVFISSVPYLTSTVFLDSRVALLLVSFVLLVGYRVLVAKLSRRLILHHFDNVGYAYE